MNGENSNMNRGSHRGSATVRRSRRRSQTQGSSLRNGASGRSGGPSNDNKKYILIGIGAALIIALAIFLFTRLSGSGSAENEVQAETLHPDAFTQDAAIDLRGVLDETAFGASGNTENNGEQADAQEGSELPTGVISIYGKTSDELRNEIMSLYSWDMKVVNGDAEVGNVVTPTVDPNETTAEATMGDPENPDALIDTEIVDESLAPSVITVSDEVSVPDLILQQLNVLIQELEEKENVFRQETASKEQAETEEQDDAEASEPAASTEIYELSLDGSEAEIDRIVELCTTMWYKAPKGASIGSFDAANNKFVMEGAESGFEVDSEALKEDITEALSAKEYTTEIQVTGEELSSDSATNLAAYKIIGTYQTKTTANSVRNKNIELACQELNGTIVLPGEEFSFNDAVGERTAEKGYGAAAAYNNGEVVQEIGGGVCQVSTTLYNAVLRSGLKTTRRQSHTFKPTYVTAGFDATISWGGPDYCFANIPADEQYSNSQTYAIGIYAEYKDRTVTVSIYGRPVLKDGYTYDLESTKVKDIPVVRKLIEPGSDQQPTTGSMGSQWQTYLIVKKDGEQIQRTLDHNTYYSGHVEYYTDETTTLAPTLPMESEMILESGSEPLIIEGPDGGPGVSGLPGGTTAPTAAPSEVPTTDVHSYPTEAPTQGPGSVSPIAPSDQNYGPGVVSGGPM